MKVDTFNVLLTDAFRSFSQHFRGKAQQQVLVPILVLPFPILDPQVEQMPKFIRIDGYPDFQCPLGWTVETVKVKILSGYPIGAGYIANNGAAVLPSQVIEANGNYEFVITQAVPLPTSKSFSYHILPASFPVTNTFL